jgi:hypothetical protein
MEQPKTSEEIVKILHSITRVEVDTCNNLDTWFEDGVVPSGINSFRQGSFTKELLELIEKHMTPLLPECPHCCAPEGMACKGPDGNWRKNHKVREKK